VKLKRIRVGEIYKHTNKITGDAYVGKTVKGWKVRWAEHVMSAALGSQTRFAKAIRKYGPESFRHCILKRATEPLLNAVEMHSIAKHGTFKNGYNMTKGGDGWLGTPAAHRKQGRSLRRFFVEHPEALAAMSARNLAFYATPLGAKCIEHISKTLEGRKIGRRARRNMTKALLERYEGEAARAVTSKAGKRYYRSAKGKAAKPLRTAAQKRARERTRAVHGSGHTPESRRLLSEAATRQWAEKRDIMMEAARRRDYTPTAQTRKKISKTLKKTYAAHPEIMLALAKKLAGRKASAETKALQSAGISAAWGAKSDAEKAAIGRRRSKGVTRHYDLIGRKPGYQPSVNAHANRVAGGIKSIGTRRANALKKAKV
jgi:hypothetical protein